VPYRRGGKGRDKERSGKGRERGKGREGRKEIDHAPLHQQFLDPPLAATLTSIKTDIQHSAIQYNYSKT